MSSDEDVSRGMLTGGGRLAGVDVADDDDVDVSLLFLTAQEKSMLAMDSKGEGDGSNGNSPHGDGCVLED